MAHSRPIQVAGQPGANGLFLLPPRPEVCQDCATDHTPDLPHNAQSLFYQVKFQMEHGRGANWKDAMAHCDDAMKAHWTLALTKVGVDVEGGKVHPAKKK